MTKPISRPKKDTHKETPASHDAWSVNDVIEFIVLYQEESDFRRIGVEGTIISIKKENLILTTKVPLKSGQLVEWDDKHRKGNLHFALVKRCTHTGAGYEVGLKLL